MDKGAYNLATGKLRSAEASLNQKPVTRLDIANAKQLIQEVIWLLEGQPR